MIILSFEYFELKEFEFFSREIIFLSCTSRTSYRFFFFKFLTSSLFFEEKALVGQGDDISQDGSATREEQEQESPVRAGRRSNRRIRIQIACYIVWKFLFRFNYSNSYSFLNRHMSSFDKSNFMVLNTHISTLMWKLYLYRDEIKHVKFFDWQNVQIIKAII